MGIIGIDHLTPLDCNQAADLVTVARVRKWRALAIKLQLVHSRVDREMLRKMLQ